MTVFLEPWNGPTRPTAPPTWTRPAAATPTPPPGRGAAGRPRRGRPVPGTRRPGSGANPHRPRSAPIRVGGHGRGPRSLGGGHRRRSDRRLDHRRRTPPGPAAEAAGAVIAGRYKLLEEIGEGGMGTVYLAEQTAAGQAAGGAQADQGRDGLADRPGPVRGRAAGPGPDGPPQHRQGPRRRHDRGRPAVLRHGAGQGRPAHRLLRRSTG